MRIVVDQNKKKRANLRDVAKAAGVSVATVSRVLNAPDVVSGETRKRVQAAIDVLHFVPSAAARSINSGRTRVVGALVPTLDNAIFSSFLATLEAGLGEHGLSLVVATTDGDPDIESEKASRLIEIGAEAMIVSGVTHSSEFDTLIKRTRLPVIATSYFDGDYHLPSIGYDNAAASNMAFQYLRSLGHQDIAVIHGPTKHNDRTRARLDGLEAPFQTFETDISLEGGAFAVGEILTSRVRSSAILCTSDVLAAGALFELQRRKIEVPDDISVMGIDNLPLSFHTVPQISTIHLPVKKMGELTADAVVQWIENQVIPKSKRIETRLIVRQSTCEIV